MMLFATENCGESIKRMFQLYHDPFTKWQETQGTKPDLYQPGAMMGCPPLGWQVTVGTSMIVYRVDPADTATLILVLIEREASRKGLHSPFGDLIRFIRLLHKSATGITHVNGHINAVSWRPKDSLDTLRIKPFYVKHLGCQSFTDAAGTEWVRGSLEDAIRLLQQQPRENGDERSSAA